MEKKINPQKVIIGAILTVVGVCFAVVMLAPVALSFHSLAGWAKDSLGLTNGWQFLVPIALDSMAITYAGLAFYAAYKGEAGGFSRMMVWLIVGASAAANWRHGAETSTDSAVFHDLMPVLAAVLLEVVLSMVKRRVMSDAGRLMAPLPKFRAVQWLISPVTTWRAWSLAVAYSISDPMEALTAVRFRQEHGVKDRREALAAARFAEGRGAAALASVTDPRDALEAVRYAQAHHITDPQEALAAVRLAQSGSNGVRVEDDQDGPQEALEAPQAAQSEPAALLPAVPTVAPEGS